MKKSLLAFALITMALGAQATELAPAAPAAVDASPTTATPAQAVVTITGASTVAGAPLELSLDGAKPSEPAFQTLFEVGKKHTKWAVTEVKRQGDKSRVSMQSTKGHAKLAMDVDSNSVVGLRIAKGTIINLDEQSSGQGSIIKFMKDKTPLGFMVNQNTAVPAK